MRSAAPDGLEFDGVAGTGIGFEHHAVLAVEGDAAGRSPGTPRRRLGTAHTIKIKARTA
ncbi:MAG: hypothetical protein IH921_06755 [Gemmatimonadetes bacterium]|nr:hypothetical protein [Gemmatimonadota bacterium]